MAQRDPRTHPTSLIEQKYVSDNRSVTPIKMPKECVYHSSHCFLGQHLSQWKIPRINEASSGTVLLTQLPSHHLGHRLKVLAHVTSVDLAKSPAEPHCKSGIIVTGPPKCAKTSNQYTQAHHSRFSPRQGKTP
jgi:hypothetical protein